MILAALHRQTIVNPYEYIYKCLETNIKRLDENSDEGKLILQYLHNGGGSNIISIFKLNRKGENSRIKKFENIKERKLLWHGTNSANIIGILMQGLRIAPPEVPNVGYMFGKGVYFADYFSKSQGYCSKEFSGGIGYFILLCEVVLGQSLVKYQADYIEKLPDGYLSTLGFGDMAPDPNQSIFTPYGVEVPAGKLKSQRDGSSLFCLSYNEFIVYDTSQIRIRYLLHLKS